MRRMQQFVGFTTMHVVRIRGRSCSRCRLHPHGPYVTPPAYWERYRHDEIDMPITSVIVPDERDNQGRWLYSHYDRGECEITDEAIRNARHAYYGSVSFVDDRVGEVLDALKAAKLDQNTVVIFTAYNIIF